MLHQYELSRYCKGLTSNMLFVLHIFLLIIQMQKLLFLVLFRYIRLCDATELNADNFSSARKQTRNTIRLLEKYKIVILLFVSCAHFQAEDGGGEARGGGFSSGLVLMPFLIDWLVIPCFVTYFLAGVSTRQLCGSITWPIHLRRHQFWQLHPIAQCVLVTDRHACVCVCVVCVCMHSLNTWQLDWIVHWH